jgi:hypothetical protein
LITPDAVVATVLESNLQDIARQEAPVRVDGERIAIVEFCAVLVVQRSSTGFSSVAPPVAATEVGDQVIAVRASRLA